MVIRRRGHHFLALLNTIAKGDAEGESNADTDCGIACRQPERHTDGRAEWEANGIRNSAKNNYPIYASGFVAAICSRALCSRALLEAIVMNHLPSPLRRSKHAS